MILTNNGTPKPQNWIWKVQMTKKENERLLKQLAAFSGEKLRHGEYRVIVRRGNIDSVLTLHSTVVNVLDDNEGANNAPNNTPTPKPEMADKAEE